MLTDFSKQFKANCYIIIIEYIYYLNHHFITYKVINSAGFNRGGNRKLTNFSKQIKANCYIIIIEFIYFSLIITLLHYTYNVKLFETILLKFVFW